MKKCPECEQVVSKNDIFCKNCGKRLKTPKRYKSKNVAKVVEDKTEIETKKPEISFAPQKETISLKEEKEKTPPAREVFFIGGIISLAIVTIVILYFFTSKSSFQKLINILPSDSLFFITLNIKEKDLQNIKDRDKYKNLLERSKKIFFGSLKNYGLRIEKVEPFLGSRISLAFIDNKIYPVYLFELTNKKELIKIIDASNDLAPEIYKKIPFYNSKEKNVLIILNEFLVATNYDNAIKIIDSFKEKKNISKSPSFRKINLNFKNKNAFAFSYLDIDRTRQFLESRNFDRYSSLLNNFKTLGIFLSGDKIKGFLITENYKAKDHIFISSTLKNILPETAFFINSRNLKEDLDPLFKENNLYLNYFKKMAEENGFNQEDLLLFLTSESTFSISVKGSSIGYNFISEIENAELAEIKIENLKKSLENYFAAKNPSEEIKLLPDRSRALYLKTPASFKKFEKTTYKDIPIFFLENNTKKIAYSLFDKKIFISSSLDFLKEIVDLNESNAPQNNNMFNFKKESPLFQNYNLSFYINPELVLKSFQGVQKLPDNITNSLNLAPPLFVKIIFDRQGIILEGKVFK